MMVLNVCLVIHECDYVELCVCSLNTVEPKSIVPAVWSGVHGNAMYHNFVTSLQTLKHVSQANSSVEHVEIVSMVHGDVMEMMTVLMRQMKMIVVSYSHN